MEEHLKIGWKVYEMFQKIDLPQIISELSQHTKCTVSKHLILEGHMYQSLDEVVVAHQQLREMIDILNEDHQQKIPIHAIVDLQNLIDIVSNEHTSLSFGQLFDIRASFVSFHTLKLWLSQHSHLYPNTAALLQEYFVGGELYHLFCKTFDEQGRFQEKAYPQIQRLKQRIQSLKDGIQRELQRLLQDTDVSSMMQESYFTIKDGRYCLPLKSNYKRNFGILHAKSHSEETCFVEPLTILPLANELKDANLALSKAFSQICFELTHAFFGAWSQLKPFYDAYLYIDILQARAKFHQKLHCILPIVKEDGCIDVQNARHPLLYLQSPNHVVSNDLHVGTNFQVAILTGPNAGGKTVALKTYGLFALMIKLGLGVPADEGSRVDFFEQVFVEMGDEQDVLSGLSTFASHIRNLDVIIQNCNSSSLILIDEIGTGTEPNQGSALAQAVLEAMLDKQSKIVFTTHYLKLKYLTQVDSRFVIGATSFEKHLPTYKVVWGKMGESFALSLAAKMGMSAKVIERAQSLLDRNEFAISHILEDVEQKQIFIEEKTMALQEREEFLRQKEVSLEEERNQWKERKSIWEREERLVLHRELQGIKEQAQNILRQHQKQGKNTTDIQQNLDQIQEFEEHNQQEIQKNRPLSKQNIVLQVGKKIQHPSLGSGVILKHQKRDKWVGIFGNLQITFSETDLFDGSLVEETIKTPETQKSKKKKSQKKHIEHIATEEIHIIEYRNMDNTIDVRGMRVDDAILYLDKKLDDMRVQNKKVVFILHGHGTGILRNAIREWLNSYSGTSRFQPASQDNGGNAYTMVVLA